jgi:hypothetical protein
MPWLLSQADLGQTARHHPGGYPGAHAAGDGAGAGRADR